MSPQEFEKLIAEGYERPPQWARDKISNVALLVEDEPSDELRERVGLAEDETLLGYYHRGPPTRERRGDRTLSRPSALISPTCG